MDEKPLAVQVGAPLHVQVASVLGQPLQFDANWQSGPDKGWHGLHDGMGAHDPIPRYDTDWSVTGPLIERYGIWVCRVEDGEWEARSGHSSWPSFCDDNDGGESWEQIADGRTPLEAVCHLLLALHAAGKLTEAAHASSPPR